MPWKEKDIQKVYFRIGEIASRVGRNKNVVRKWCRFFELRIKKNTSGELAFDKKALHKIRCIAYLSKDMSLQKVKNFVQEGWPSELDLFKTIKEKRWRMKRKTRVSGGVTEKSLHLKSRLLM